MRSAPVLNPDNALLDDFRGEFVTFNERKPRPLGRGPSDSQTRTTAGLRLSGVGYGGKHDGRKHGRLDWVPAGRESVEPKQQPLPDCACPLWHTGQAGRWHGLCAPGPKGPGAGVSALPRGRTGRTPQGDSATAKRRSRNTPHPTRDSRSAHTPQAVPLPPPGRKPRGRGRVAVKTLASDGPDPRTVLPGAMAAPTPRVGTPALKSGEDVKAQMSPTAKGTVETPELGRPGVAITRTLEMKTPVMETPEMETPAVVMTRTLTTEAPEVATMETPEMETLEIVTQAIGQVVMAATPVLTKVVPAPTMVRRPPTRTMAVMTRPVDRRWVRRRRGRPERPRHARRNRGATEVGR